MVPLLALLALLAGLQAATQFLAHDLQYHAALGAHWRGVYLPWASVLWAAQWYGHYPDVFQRAASVGTCARAMRSAASSWPRSSR